MCEFLAHASAVCVGAVMAYGIMVGVRLIYIFILGVIKGMKKED